MNQTLKIILRSIIKGRYYSLISVAGLSIAMAVVLLVALLVEHETSYDEGFAESDSIYRLTWQNNGTGDRFATMFNAFSKQMKIDFDEVEETARLGVYDLTLQRTDSNTSATGASMRYESIAMTDPAFFSMFDFEFVAGGPEALNQPNSIVMTQAGAERYFPGTDPMGQTLILENKLSLTVGGIVKELPGNTHFTLHYFVTMESLRGLYDGARFLDSWASDTLYHYILLRDNVSIKQLEQQLPIFLERHDHEWPLGSVDIELQPLNQIHFTTDISWNTPPGWRVTFDNRTSPVAGYPEGVYELKAVVPLDATGGLVDIIVDAEKSDRRYYMDSVLGRLQVYPVTVVDATRMDTTGSQGVLTTSSTSPGTGWARPRSRAPSFCMRLQQRRLWSAFHTRSRARGSMLL